MVFREMSIPISVLSISLYIFISICLYIIYIYVHMPRNSFPGGSAVENLPAVQETQLLSLGQEDPLEEETATHYSILSEKPHGQRCLAGYSPWGSKELNMTEHTHTCLDISVQFSSVAQSCPTLCNLMIAAHQASLSITNSQSLLKLMPIESVMPSSHPILRRPLLLLPPIPPSIRVFSNESTLHMRWAKYWSFSFSISPSNEHPGLISFRMDWLDLLAVHGTLKSLLQHHSSKPQFLGAQLSSQSNSHIHT